MAIVRRLMRWQVRRLFFFLLISAVAAAQARLMPRPSQAAVQPRPSRTPSRPTPCRRTSWPRPLRSTRSACAGHCRIALGPGRALVVCWLQVRLQRLDAWARETMRRRWVQGLALLCDAVVDPRRWPVCRSMSSDMRSACTTASACRAGEAGSATRERGSGCRSWSECPLRSSSTGSCATGRAATGCGIWVVSLPLMVLAGVSWRRWCRAALQQVRAA